MPDVRPLSECPDLGKTSDHVACVTAVLMCCRALEAFDLPTAIASAEQAHGVGVFFDPTTWILNERKLREDIETLKAALPLYDLARKLRARAGEPPAEDAPKREKP